MDTLTNDAAQKQPEEGQRAYRRAGLQRFFLHRHFALLWSGQTVSAFGSYITGIGLPMAALLLLHASPAQMGLLIALGALPGLLAGLFIGSHAFKRRVPHDAVTGHFCEAYFTYQFGLQPGSYRMGRIWPEPGRFINVGQFFKWRFFYN